MFGEIAAIEKQTETKKALVIDHEVEFCVLIKFYLSEKNFDVYTSYNLRDALAKVEMETPDIIIADPKFHPKLNKHLKEKIESIPGYSPKVYVIGSNAKEPEGAVIYTLKKNYYKSYHHKLDRYNEPKSLWEKITNYINDLFK